MRRLLLLATLATATLPAAADPVRVLFVGNSYTFGRLDPVLSYNAANVFDLTRPQGPLTLTNTGAAPFSNITNTNSYPVGTIVGGELQPSYSPHFQSDTAAGAWGGVPGIFKQMTVQAGLDYEVSLSTRNGATLRGHFLNTANPTNWDLRGNIASKSWNKVVLQEQSDEPLTAKTVNGVALNSNFTSFQAYSDMIEDYVHQGSALSFRELVLGIGTSNAVRTIPANPNANPAAQVYLQQTWARPNLINAPGATTIDPVTGNASYAGAPATSFFANLEEMTDDLRQAYTAAAANALSDGSPGMAGIAPVGDSFLRAVQEGIATRDMYAADALTDGKVDLWFNDGTHASVHGSYLSALTLFGTLTGLDPRSLGAGEIAAADLGISAADAMALQGVASRQLGFAQPVPEPATAMMMLAGLLAVGAAVRRRAA